MTLTNTELLRECGKTLIATKETKQSSEQLQLDIEMCVETWTKTHADVMGFIFPQTPTHRPIVVSVIGPSSSATPKPKPPPKELMTDKILQFVSKKVVDTFQQCRSTKKDVAWTWPVIEMYINEYYREKKEEPATPTVPPKKEALTTRQKIRISASTPRHSKTSSVDQPQPNTYIVVSFPIGDTVLHKMYNLLMDLREVKEFLKVMQHEHTKFEESILRNVTQQHQRQQIVPSPTLQSPSVSSSSSRPVQSTKPPLKYSESIFIERPSSKSTDVKTPKATPIEVEFKANDKRVYTTTRITKDNYLNTLRVKHMRANTEFEPMLTIPVDKSITSHPFYLFLRHELLQCREQTYRLMHPNEPLVRTDLKVGLKRRKLNE